MSDEWMGVWKDKRVSKWNDRCVGVKSNLRKLCWATLAKKMNELKTGSAPQKFGGLVDGWMNGWVDRKKLVIL